MGKDMEGHQTVSLCGSKWTISSFRTSTVWSYGVYVIWLKSAAYLELHMEDLT